MPDQASDGCLDLAVNGGFHQHTVFAGDVTVGKGGRHRQAPIAHRMIIQAAAEIDQKAGRAGADQGLVEGPMHIFPTRIFLEPGHVGGPLGADQAVEGQHQSLLPRHTAMRDRLTQRDRFHPAACIRQFGQFRRAHPGHHEPALLEAREETFHRQLVQRLPHWRTGGAGAGASFLDAQFLPGRQAAGKNVAAQTVIRRGCEGSRHQIPS